MRGPPCPPKLVQRCTISRMASPRSMSAEKLQKKGTGRRLTRQPAHAHAPVRVASELQREFPAMDRRATEVLINLIRTDSLVGSLLARRFRRYGLSISGFNALVILRQSRTQLHPHEF